MLTSEGQTKRLEVTPEGWVVDDLKAFQLFAGHPPPRPYGYLDQLKEDARNWKPVAFWLVGAGLLLLAAVTGWRVLLPLGVGVLACWFGFFWSTVRSFRHAPVLVGRIETLGRHPLLAGYATARARLDDGQQIPVTFLSRLAAEILAEPGRAEVLILYTPRSEYSFGFAARALPKEVNG